MEEKLRERIRKSRNLKTYHITEVDCILENQIAIMEHLCEQGAKTNNNTTYWLIHRGNNMTGIVVVVEENLDRAKERIEKELLLAGFISGSFNLNDVKPVDLKLPGSVFVDING